MKIELKENMYIRTKDGIIDKVIIDYNGHCARPNCECKHISCAKNYYDEYKIVKASYNIIDILEVGDYVNGFKVSEIERYDTNTIIKIGNSTFNVLEGEKIYTPSYDNNNGYEKIEKLKSIVTKEQMEQMSYKIKE